MVSDKLISSVIVIYYMNSVCTLWPQKDPTAQVSDTTGAKQDYISWQPNKPSTLKFAGFKIGAEDTLISNIE